jgi:hypothetical protein
MDRDRRGPGPWVVAALACALAAHPARAEPEFLGQIAIDGVAGLSGIVMTEGGGRLTGVTDRGRLITAHMRRDFDGRPVAVADLSATPLLNAKGAEVTPFQSDAEDLAARPDGTLFVAFESYTRVMGLDAGTGRTRSLHRWDLFKPLWGNEGFEALVALPGGRLLAILEACDSAAGGYRTYLGTGMNWPPGPVFPSDCEFSASGADLGPDGKIWLLERQVGLTLAVTSRVSRYAPDGSTGPDTVLQTRSGDFGNLEGISLWDDASGRRVMSLVSDSGDLPFGSTYLVEYRLDP